MTDTVELWSPITDDGVRMTPGELIVEFMDLISDRNSTSGICQQIEAKEQQ